MHQSVVTVEQFSDIFDHLSDRQRTDTGMFLTTTGRHPDLGSVIAIQDTEDGMILLSEHPVECCQ